jgi:hypothetical protein
VGEDEDGDEELVKSGVCGTGVTYHRSRLRLPP